MGHTPTHQQITENRKPAGSSPPPSRSLTMERPNRLADLKLVNKYYPATATTVVHVAGSNGVANYSYPSPKLDSSSAARSGMGGRSSVGSQASVPGMVDDRASDISIDEQEAATDPRDSYHICGAELWDSFWEDPFWEANAEEASREADGATRRIINSGSAQQYSPVLVTEKEEGDVMGRVSSSTWPLSRLQRAAIPSPLPPTTPKASYSLFPRQTPPPIVNIIPRRPSLPPQTSSLLEFPMQHANSSSVSLSSLGGSGHKARKSSTLSTDSFVSQDRSSWTHSAPVTPLLMDGDRLPVRRRDSSRSSLSQTRQRFPIKLPRTRSDTVVSQTSITSAFYTAMPNNSHEIISITIPTGPPPPRPQRSPERPLPRGRLSQTDLQVPLPQPPVLHRARTETHLPIYTQLHTPNLPPPPPQPKTQPPTPTMVSVFELDSDSESSDSEDEIGFARRLARSFTPHKRTRSASAAPRSRKGGEVAKEQLRRARAGTLATTPPCEGEERVLRRQKSEIFGKILWSRR